MHNAYVYIYIYMNKYHISCIPYLFPKNIHIMMIPILLGKHPNSGDLSRRPFAERRMPEAP